MSGVDRNERFGRREIDRRWKDYPEGTRAYSSGGGFWEKDTYGDWIWMNGKITREPGDSAESVGLPEWET